MARDTSPCSDETALARRDSFSPSTVMQNCSLVVVDVRVPKPIRLSCEMPSSIAQRPEMLFDQVGAETVVAGGHRSMRREDHFARDIWHGLRRKSSPSSSIRDADRLQHREPAVPFVQMKHAGRNAHRLAARGRRRRPSSSSWRMRVRPSPP